MKPWLSACGYLALILGLVVLVAQFFSSNEEAFQRTDPKGYKEWQEEARAEGIPDPRS